MDKQNSNYTANYLEEQCIGRGSFGAAMIVTHKKEGKKYVAKKIILEGLEPKEQENCMMEVNLMKNLDHPNIVKYKESFLTAHLLVIIMEYCEVGDLAYHIKRKVSKPGEHFTEMEIFNWFVQICLALEYVHARRVIHRDIKTQNIFLSGSNTIKVGDFGISKVLESTT
jgi:NIMA (never in mitosis gene a)-related kinase